MSNTQDTEIITDTSALGQIERAQIDMQIATARRYPRQLSLVKQRMLSFATLDEETAAGCFYTLPGRKGGDGKPLQGPSVRLAEIARSCYQNLKSGSRIIGDDGKFVTAQGVVHDLENNVCNSIEVKRRVTKTSGERFSDDMIATTCNAACAIALRNATYSVVPMALIKPVYEAAKKLAIGDAKSLVQRRSASIDHFAKLGVSKEKVCEALVVRSVDDIQLDHLEILIGYATAIKDGDVSIDEIFKAKHPMSDANPNVKPSNPYAVPDLKGSIPDPEPAPDSPLVVSPDTERDQLLGDIRDFLAEHDSSNAKFLPLCRTAGLLASGVNLQGATIETLRSIHENRLAVLKGEYKGGSEV